MILTSARRRAAIPPLLALALATPGVSTSATAGSAPCASDAPRLVISHAGSLTSSFVPVEAEFTRRTGVCVVDLSGGSVKLGRDLGRDGGGIDIFASADAEVNERMLKPAGIVTYTIRFAEGRMVLAYTGASKGAATIAAAAAPGTIAQAAPDWAAQLTRPGVLVGGAHPFLDPGGYGADMVFQLAQLQAQTPDLYNALLSHFTTTRPGDTLGTNYDYQLTYEHSARAAQAQDRSGGYRYARLPDAVDLGAAGQGARYAAAGVTMPGIDGPASAPLRIPATRVTWGLSIVGGAPNRQSAEQFLQLFFSPQGLALRSAGPTPIDPPLVDRADIGQLPPSLRKIVRAAPGDGMSHP